MKQIKSFPIWVNGQTIDAVFFLLHINFDNLTNQAIFYYALKDADTNIITQNDITMSDIDYQNWNGSNDYAWNWASKQLGLTIIA